MSPAELSPFSPPPQQAPGAAVEIVGEEVVTCWSGIGVYGKGTCHELKVHIHCHHCPVFCAAGLRLLNRPLTPEYRDERTRQFALQKETRETTSASAVLFRIRGEWLALPTAVFQEVTEKRAIHSLPHRRTGSILGLANVRGELLICISIGHLLGMENMPTLPELRASYHRLLVVCWEGTRLAFLVDEVQGPQRFDAQSLRALPATLSKVNPGYTQHVLFWLDNAVGLLDPELIFAALNGNLA